MTDEVSRMVILRKNREIRRGFSRLNHNFDWILFTGWVPAELNFCDAELHSRLSLLYFSSPP